MPNQPEYIIVHTAALEGSDYDISDINEWHRDRGWKMVGYHYFITKDGTVQKGRDEEMVGAHCRDRGMNHKSIGICLQGHGDKEEWTEDQTRSFEALSRKVMGEYEIPTENILGHRETGANKSCPGTRIDMDEVRSLLSIPADLDPVAVLPPAVLDQHSITT